MNEQMGNGPSLEEKQRLDKIAQDQADEELLQNYLATQPDALDPTKDLKEEAGPLIEDFETLLNSFEATYSLEDLRSIVDISPDLSELFLFTPILADLQRIENDIQTYERYNPSYIPIYKEKIAKLQALILIPEEKRKYELRMAARKDLNDISPVLLAIKNHTTVSAEQLEILTKKFKYLSNAVGTVRNNKVIHDL